MADFVRFGDIVNSSAGLVNSVSSAAYNLGLEQAQVDLNEMKAQLDYDSNEFLLQLQQSNNYDDWGNEINKFIKQKENLSKEKPLDGQVNPYYCRNNYTAQKAKEMFAGQNENLRNKVFLMSLAKQQDEQNASSERTVNLIKTNAGLNTQNKIDQMQDVRSNSFVHGNIQSYSEYCNEVKKDATDVYLEELLDEGKNLISQNADWDEVTSAIDQMPNDISIKVLKGSMDIDTYNSRDPNNYKDISNDIDVKKIKDNVKKQLESDWNAQRQKLWNTNESDINKFYNKLCINDDPEKQLQMAKQGLYTLSNMSPNKDMSNNDYEHWTEKFKSIINSYDKNKGTKGGSNKESLPSLKEYIKNHMESYMADAKAGIIDAEEAKQALRDTALDALQKGEIKDYKAQSKDDAQRILDENVNKEFVDFMSNFVDYALDPKYYGTSNQKLKDLAKDIAKNPDLYPNTTIGYLFDNVTDLMTTTDMSKLNDKDLLEKIDGWTKASYAAKVQAMMDKKNITVDDATNISMFKNDKAKNEYFTTQADVAANNDVIMGKNGEVKFKSKEDQKAVENYTKTAQVEIANALGLDPKQLKQSYMKDEYGDETPVSIFTAPDGKQYRIAPVYKTKGKGEKQTKTPIDYKMVETDAKGTEKTEIQKRAINQDLIDKQNQTKQNIKNTNDEAEKLRSDRVNADVEAASKTDNLPSLITDIKQIDWDNMTPQERNSEIQYAINALNKGNKKLLAKLNCTKEQWNQLTPEEKRNAVINGTIKK